MTHHGDDHRFPSEPLSDGPDEELDLLLARSAPAVSPPTAERTDELAGLVAATRLEVLSGPARVRRLPRAAAFAGVGALVLAGAGAGAAAAGWHWRSPWADHAVARLHFTVPSGAACEEIIGGFTGPPDTVRAAERYVGSVDLASVVDVEAAYSKVRITSSDGSELPPSDQVNDVRYRIGVTEGVYGAIASAVEREGLSTDRFQIEGEAHCAGDEQ